MKIGIKLKEARLKKELTQENVANILSVSRTTISSWEVGRSYPDLQSIVSLSDLYDISLDKLLREDSDMVKKLSQDSKIVNKFNKLIIYLPIISFIIFLCSFLYANWGQKTYDDLTEQMNKDMKALSLKYDMTELDKYKKEVENIVSKNRIKAIEIYVADKEKDNTNLDSNKNDFKLVYETTNHKSEDGINVLKNSMGFSLHDILDKDGNILHYQYYTKSYPIYEMEFIALVSGALGILSSLSIIIFKLKKINIT